MEWHRWVGPATAMMTRNWNTITHSRYEHERRGLDFIRERLADQEPLRAWSNFEFVSDSGAVYEVDLLVLTRMGLFLVELKGRPGRVAGDVRTWTWTRPDGKIVVDDNPLFLANQKARTLAAVLARQPVWGKVRCPFIEALVFLSDPDLECGLDEPARSRVCLTDREPGPDAEDRDGIIAALLERRARGLEPYPRNPIDAAVARTLARAVEAAGIRPSERSRRVGEYILGDLLWEGPGFQDREARHAYLEATYRRVRTYLVARLTDEAAREPIARAARREFQTLQGLNHPGILAALDYQEHELGPCLIFRHEPGSVRLDHFLARRVHQLDFGQRLGLLRQVADAVRYAHSKRVIHRALSPESILIERPDSDAPEPRIFHWQLSARRGGSTTPSGTIHLEPWLAASERIYLAPETLLAPEQAQEAADVFSLGTIAYHLFAGRPPASSELAMRDLLREHRGLRLSSVLDACGVELEQLVAWSTHPDPNTRLASVEDFLAQLDAVEEEATRPDGPAECPDPLAAAIGDALPGGFVVEKKLGSGSTAQAIWVRKGDAPFVLKVARTPDDGQRLRDEAEVLRKLRSEFIVNLVDIAEMNGRTVLVLSNTGDETLAQRLEREGRQRGLGLELLQRFGEDLLSAVASLERNGIPHRDIKPDNIAVRRVGEQKELHLTLFDFSLSRAPVDDIRLGTRGYLDPFLGQRPSRRWDLAAERYAAAATLHEMATGRTPQWGDGAADADLTGAELVIDASPFDPAVRPDLAAFFRRALHRDPRQRFENAEEMRAAWRRVFDQAGRSRAGREAAAGPAVPIEQATAETPIALLGLSTRATNALDRAGVVTVGELLARPAQGLRFMPGVGQKTRLEIVGALEVLRDRLSGEVEPPPEPRPAPPEEDGAAAALDLAGLVARVVGTASKAQGPSAFRARVLMLGLDDKVPAGPGDWPTQAQVAQATGVTRARVGQILNRDRQRWLKDAAVTRLREQVIELVDAAGGVLELGELVEGVRGVVPAAAGAGEGEATDQGRQAAALARAAVEAELGLKEPRLVVRRPGGRVLIARTEALAEYAARLGGVADAIAAEDPLASPARVMERLMQVARPAAAEGDGFKPLTADRLLRLAARASRTAAVSSRQELYPRDMDAERALRLSIGALSGLDRLDPDEIRARVAGRYPEALPLPDPPLLDRLLEAAGLDLTYDPQAGRDDVGAYVRTTTGNGHLATNGSSLPARLSTRQTARRPPSTPEITEARLFEEQLRRSLTGGKFLVLTVRPSGIRAAEAELAERFRLRAVSVDRLLIRHLKARAEARRVKWPVVTGADAASPGSRDWQNLLRLVGEAMPAAEAELFAGSGPILLTCPGLLARYDQVDWLTRLAARAGKTGDPPAIWVLVAGDGLSARPVLDGKAIPVLDSSQYAHVPESWLENRHRAGL